MDYYNKDRYTDFVLNGVKERGFPQIKDVNVPHGSGILKSFSFISVEIP